MPIPLGDVVTSLISDSGGLKWYLRQSCLSIQLPENADGAHAQSNKGVDDKLPQEMY